MSDLIARPSHIAMAFQCYTQTYIEKLRGPGDEDVGNLFVDYFNSHVPSLPPSPPFQNYWRELGYSCTSTKLLTIWDDRSADSELWTPTNSLMKLLIFWTSSNEEACLIRSANLLQCFSNMPGCMIVCVSVHVCVWVYVCAWCVHEGGIEGLNLILCTFWKFCKCFFVQKGKKTSLSGSINACLINRAHKTHNQSFGALVSYFPPPLLACKLPPHLFQSLPKKFTAFWLEGTHIGRVTASRIFFFTALNSAVTSL